MYNVITNVVIYKDIHNNALTYINLTINGSLQNNI